MRGDRSWGRPLVKCEQYLCLAGIPFLGSRVHLQDLIPGLLSSSYLPPSPFAVGLQLTNVHALHVLVDTIKATGRVDRWRGQILDAVGRNWIGIEEHISLRELTGGKAGKTGDEQVGLPELQAVQALLKVIVNDLVQVRPDMRQVSSSEHFSPG